MFAVTNLLSYQKYEVWHMIFVQDLDNETLLHIDAENRRQTLEEELEFLKSVHEQVSRVSIIILSRFLPRSLSRSFYQCLDDCLELCLDDCFNHCIDHSLPRFVSIFDSNFVSLIVSLIVSLTVSNIIVWCAASILSRLLPMSSRSVQVSNSSKFRECS